MKMYMHCLRYVVRKPAFTHFSSCSARFYSTTKTSKPLRILFCGSEEFSAASLKALHEEQIQNPGLIQSIDVLIRPGKPFGRNFKTIREVPLKTTASLLGLTVHERDTFTGWDLPRAKGGPINLIIAVSFGLFVPPRILNSVEYGGLNVHPSLLPEFRGPAPLQYSIMHGLPKTGVTLQTLDPKAFDQGTILAQSLSIPIPNYKTTTYRELRDFLAPKAAEMLIQALRDRAFVPPLQDVGWYKSTKPIHAYKISAADKEIKWHEWTSVMVDRQYRAVGRLWNNIRVNIVEKKHVLFDSFEVVPKPAIFKEWVQGRKYDEKTGHLLPQKSDEQVRFFVYEAEGNKVMAQMYIEDGEAIILCCGMDRVDCVKVRRMTIGGESSKPAAQVMRQFKGRELWQLTRGARNVGGMSVQPRGEVTI